MHLFYDHEPWTCGLRTALLLSSLLLLVSIEARALQVSEYRLTVDPSYQGEPDIYGDIVIWRDLRNGSGAAIYSYDLQTDTESQVAVSAGSHATGQDLYEDNIVWSRNTWEDVFLYNIGTQQEMQITNAPSFQVVGGMDGSSIVWEDYRNGGSEIYLFDTLSGQEHLVSRLDMNPDQLNNGSNPAIHGRYVVWQGMSSGTDWWDIYLYDMGLDQRFGTADDIGQRQITSAPETQAQPVVFGDWIVWSDERDGQSDIYAYDLSTDSELRLTSDPSFQGNPAIYGDRVVYDDLRDGNPNIYMYDLGLGNEFQLTSDPGDQSWADIFEDTVVWRDNRNGNQDIYLGIIPEPTTTLLVGCGVLAVALARCRRPTNE